jgi:ubiquinone/menaquinone biosynthesis C-methylase UbiE
MIPDGATVLDVGCGNGRLSAGVLESRSDLHIEGVDIDSVPESVIPIRRYNGIEIPCPDDSWDVCMANDVIHHCEDPRAILKEMRRVARTAIVLKDHIADSFVDFQFLKFMDWVGNAGYGTPLPYNFLSTKEWEDLFEELGLEELQMETNLSLYPPALLGILDRKMHFLTVLSLST